MGTVTPTTRSRTARPSRLGGETMRKKRAKCAERIRALFVAVAAEGDSDV